MEVIKILDQEQIATLASRKICVVSGTRTDIIAQMGQTNPVVTLSTVSEMPTEKEIVALNDYLEYVLMFNLGPRTGSRLMASPAMPKAEGLAISMFIKGPAWECNGPDGWAFRRTHWTEGPTYAPGPSYTDKPPWTLEKVLAWASNPKWREALKELRQAA